MKKLFAMMMALVMLLSSMAAFADVSEDAMDIDHDVAYVYINDGEEIVFKLDSVEVDEDSIDLLYFADSGEIMVVVMAIDIGLGYYEAGEGQEDLLSVAYIHNDDNIYITSCSDYGYADGYGANIIMSAIDEDGWYQGMVQGTMTSEDTSTVLDILMIFDFIWDGTTAVAEDEYIDIDLPVEDEEEAADEEYYIADTATIVVGEDYYEMPLFEAEVDSGIFAMYIDEESGCMFAVGIEEGLEVGSYYPEDVDSEAFYCAFVDAEGNTYMGGCSNENSGEFAECYLILDADGSVDGLYQMCILGEGKNEAGETKEIIGFVDFTLAPVEE